MEAYGFPWWERDVLENGNRVRSRSIFANDGRLSSGAGATGSVAEDRFEFAGAPSHEIRPLVVVGENEKHIRAFGGLGCGVESARKEKDKALHREVSLAWSSK